MAWFVWHGAKTDTLYNVPPPINEPIQDVPRARDLILRYGWNAACYQILNPGIAHYFSPRHEAVVGYVPARTGPLTARSRVRLVAGAPVCDEEKLPAVVDEWETDARQSGARVCYFGAAGRLMTLLGNRPNYSTVLLGAQPTWNPHHFAQIVARRASLRAQIRRAQNKNVVVREWHAERAANNPALLACLQEWLATRSLPAMRFLVEPDTLGRLFDRRVFVAEQNGAPVAWAVCSPIPARNGWLVEQVVRGANAPNGCAELLISELMAALAESKAACVTLGLVPLSHHVSLKDWGGNPPWLQLVLRHVRAHGRRFYNFNGLDKFRAKMEPDTWEPIYAIANESGFSPQTLWAIADAFSHGSPVRAVGKGIGRAIKQEAQWLVHRAPT